MSVVAAPGTASRRPPARASERRSTGSDRVLAVLVVCAAVLVAFDDIQPLRIAAGTFGASLAWVPLLLCRLVLPGRDGAAWPSPLLWVWTGGAIVTLFTFFVLPARAGSVNLYAKAVFVGVPILVFLYIVTVAARIGTHRPYLITVFGLVSLATLALFAGLEAVGMIPNRGTWFLHGLENLNWRLRGSRFEASVLGAGLLIALATCVARVRNRILASVTGLIALAIGWLTQSRGTLVVAIVFCVATMVSAVVRLSRRDRIPRPTRSLLGWGLALVTVVGGFGLSALVTAQGWAALSQSTSDAVRSVWGIVGLRAAVDHPLGMGFAGSLAWLPPYVTEAMDGMAESFSSSSFSELLSQLGADGDQGFSPKTLPSLVGVYFGALGILLLLGLWLRLGRDATVAARNGFRLVPAAAVTACFVTTTYFSSIYAWEQAVLFGALLAAPHWSTSADRPAGSADLVAVR